MLENIIKELNNLKNTEIKLNEPMKAHTSFKIGGPVDIMAMVKDIKDIKNIIKIANKFQIPYMIMGNGSNLLVKDTGVEGIIIKLNDNFKDYTVKGDTIIAQSGLLLSELSEIAYENELKGLEFAGGIPGTAGGGLTMNCGAYGSEMKDIVKKAVVLNEDLEIEELFLNDLELSYRNTIIQKRNLVVLEIEYQLEKGNKKEIKDKMIDLTDRRRTKQPLEYPSGGSTFKRPEGYFAGKLVDDSGLRGLKYRGAQVSEKHCGFIINKDNASCEDVLRLINTVQKIVYDNYGVKLEREIKIIGK